MIDRFAIIVGAMKAGTTSLFHYLSQHPEIAACSQKEPNFFCQDQYWERGLDWYENLWEWDPSRHRIALEASVSYTKLPKFPNAAKRIATIDRPFKFIYLVRDPIERIESHLTHSKARDWGQDILHAINVSRYATQIAPFVDAFGRDSVLVVDFGELKRSPKDVARRVLEFLGLKEYAEITAERAHNTSRGIKRHHRIVRGLRALPTLKTLYKTAIPDARTRYQLQRRVLEFIGEPVERVVLNSNEKQQIAFLLRNQLRSLESDLGMDLSAWPTTDPSSFGQQSEG